tara:strand:- start:414 stop:1259 length:846 start_codon:yes stop_codon:yes gene_type:complete
MQLKFIVKSFFLFHLIAFVSIKTSYSQNIPIVAIVNGQQISLETLIIAANELPQEIQSQPFINYYEDLLERIVDINLISQAAKSQNLDDDPNVISAIAFIEKKVLMQAYLANIVQKTITDDELRKAYENFIGDTAVREEIKASHILLETKNEAENVIKLLKKGQLFSDLAKTYSTGPSGPTGGDLGWFTRGKMVPSFEKAAFDLEEGEITKTPVQTQFGWHVIKISKKRLPEPPNFESVKFQLAQDIERRVVAKTIEELKAKAKIEKMSVEDLKPLLNNQN